MTWTAPPRRTGTPEVLVIDRRVDADRALLLPRGRLVHGCTAVLADALAALPSGLARLDLDMGAVEFMDPAGLRFLDLLGGYSHRESVPATTANWRGQPVRILEGSGLDTTDPLRTTTRARGPGPAPGPGPGSAPRTASAAPGHAPGTERADRLRTLEQEVGQLRHALASRPVIDQARGVLMALHACTSDEAWHILREASQLSNTKLRTVAAAVVAGAGSGSPPPPPEVRAALRTALGRLGRRARGRGGW
ncbi:ANTAR domain-containing protein [Streptomyces mayonensis]|uniref:ANTAR domain-containing protein n=1 Tax=Streptomyces mayonensis TaxID=2750816 RepID=UPI001C1E199D|nr:ANTAR domain-containing protein [Streptomyces sp. A108]MBU6533023.1 ANTAR domain-containing protein [Streptomyces sp. A108]